MEAIKIESFCRFKFLSDPRFSPDGSYIAFIVQHADLKDNDYKGDLYLYDCGSGSVRRLTAGGDVKSYAWTGPDTLLFPAGRDGNKDGTSYYGISLSGGEAEKRFDIPLKADKIVPLESGRFLIAATDRINDEERNEAYEVFDEVPFWSNGKGVTNGDRRGLYIYDPADGTLNAVSAREADVGQFSVRGDKVLYTAYPWTKVRGERQGVYLYDLKSGEVECLVGKDKWNISMIGFWADDEAVVAAVGENPYGNDKYPDFYRLDFARREMEPIAGYDYSCGHGTVASDARLGGGETMKAGEGICYFITTRGHDSLIYSVDKSGSIAPVYTERGSCDSFDIADDGRVVVCGLYGDKLAELYLDGKQITDLSGSENWLAQTPEEIHFTGRWGDSLYGWVIRPAGYVPGRKYPAILHIHGGPRTVFGTAFHHEMQVWAAAGYFVFYTNPHGSDGYGTEFGALNGKYGTIDYEDLMDFTDAVLEQEPDIDRERVGVGGGSYGGFMTNWIIGHTDRFKAAVSQRSIASWISFEYMSDIGQFFTKDTQSVFACEDVDTLWEHSPLKWIAGCKTPTLFFHSDEDYRCPVSQGMQMFAALKILGVETRMCVVHGENHELSRSGKPRNRILRMKEILEWFDGHLKPSPADLENPYEACSPKTAGDSGRGQFE